MYRNGLASSTSQVWTDILATPNAALSTLPGSDNPSRAQSNATTIDQRVASPDHTNVPATQAGLDVANITASGEATAGIDCISTAEGTVVGSKDGADDEGNASTTQSDAKLAGDEGDEVAARSEEQECRYVFTCCLVFGEVTTY